jgi:flagellar biosynthesis protein FlhF
MTAKRFYASRAREALEMVRNEFGPDANIISNKMVNGWNEIIATRGEDSEAENVLGDQSTQRPLRSQVPQPLDQSVRSSMQKPLTSPLLGGDQVHTNDIKYSSTGLNKDASTQVPTQGPNLDDLMVEIRKMKRSFETQISEISWTTNETQPPVKQELMKAMLNAGFGVSVTRRLVDRLPSDFSSEQALGWAREVLSKNICLSQSEQELFERGGVIALIGPTGVGKTTTLAKIAARFVQSHGAEKLAMITTDAYRVGGYEQLKIFGKILGVIVHCVKDQEELDIALREFKHKHLVLIDTAGMSQRDRMAHDQLEMISKAQASIYKILCLNTTASLDTLDDVVNRFSTRGLDGCVLTKIDEAITIGGALNIAMQHKLAVLYTTNGQRVPQDIDTVEPLELINFAFDDASRRHNDSAHVHDDIAVKMRMNERVTDMTERSQHV